ncbi:MAG: response regulator [Deltaproteobacteria bacterium]|nr:response regulator [Deltaproteobacteria bacterium]
MKHILVVDDQPFMRQLFIDRLADKDCLILGAESIQSDEKYLETFKFDLVILDLYINGFQGLDFLLEIKVRYAALPVLLFTAYDNFKNDPRVQQADGYLIKNLKDIDLIYQKVGEFLI